MNSLLLIPLTLIFGGCSCHDFSHTNWSPSPPLPTTFSSSKECYTVYASCMQSLSFCYEKELPFNLTVCDNFQDRCDKLYSSCKAVEIPLYSIPYKQTETEQCMAEYDECLSLQSECKNITNRTPLQNAACPDIVETCHTILYSCSNTGRKYQPGPAITVLGSIWTPSPTFLAPSPTIFNAISNSHCMATYQHCKKVHETCLDDVKRYAAAGTLIDADHRAKACYQILLRCQSQIPLCLDYPNLWNQSLATWIPDRISQGVEIPAWVPPGIRASDSNFRCIAGYQRCLILYRNCLLTATMWQDAGWLEKAEIHRNRCQEKLVPLCMNGVSICSDLKE